MAKCLHHGCNTPSEKGKHLCLKHYILSLQPKDTMANNAKTEKKKKLPTKESTKRKRKQSFDEANANLATVGTTPLVHDYTGEYDDVEEGQLSDDFDDDIPLTGKSLRRQLQTRKDEDEDDE